VHLVPHNRERARRAAAKPALRSPEPRLLRGLGNVSAASPPVNQNLAAAFGRGQSG
jgi:hypothetical protein